jgi:hypothetical protein
MVSDLLPIFLTNLQDLNNLIGEKKTLWDGILTMQYTEFDAAGKVTYSQVLLESIHHTGNPYKKVALVPTRHYTSAISQLTAAHSSLQEYIHPSFHDKVFIAGKEVTLAGQQAYSISSSSYAARVDQLLGNFNPQDDTEAFPQDTNTKRARHIPLSYATAVLQEEPTAPSHTVTTAQPLTASTLTETDIDLLYQRMSTYFPQYKNADSSLTTDNLETYVWNCQSEISTLCSDLDSKVDIIQQDVESVKTEIKKQNIIIMGIQHEVQAALQDFAMKLYTMTNMKPALGAAASLPQP